MQTFDRKRLRGGDLGQADRVQSVLIREARSSDVGVLSELYRRSSLSNDGDRDQLLAAPGALIFDAAAVRDGRTRVAEVDGRIVGFASAHAGVDTAELDDLFVDPDWMRRGVATQLMADIGEVMRSRGMTRIEVTANDHALAFYTQVGFVAGARVTTQLGVGTRMRLELET
jgi:GNAT superfamily N-acetyltransferase